MTTTNTETISTPDPYAGHTPGPLMAIKGDTLNPDRPWGVVRYLSREVCEELGDDPADYPSRTEVVAEICASSDPSQTEADARLFADAPAILAERDALRAEVGRLRSALRARAARLDNNLHTALQGLKAIEKSADAAGLGGIANLARVYIHALEK